MTFAGNSGVYGYFSFSDFQHVDTADSGKQFYKTATTHICHTVEFVVGSRLTLKVVLRELENQHFQIEIPIR